MKYSKNGLQLTESFEGCKLKAYQDSVGVWTIGYGHTRGVFAGMTCTQAQAEIWLIEDVQVAEIEVTHCVHVSINQNEYDALVDFVFNAGSGNFERSSMLRFLNQNKMELASLEFEKWDMAGGKHIAGLLRRRQAEKAEFLGHNNGT